jgi:thymidine phosphorylase
VSATAGVLLRAKPGDFVSRGAPLVELHTEDESSIPRALAALDGAFSIFDDPYEPRPLVLERVSA